MSMSEQQKQSRKRIRQELKYLLECNKLPLDDNEYASAETIKEIIFDCPEYDLSKEDKIKYEKLLHDN